MHLGGVTTRFFWHLSLPPPLVLLLSSSLTPFLASCCCSFASHCSGTAPVVQLRLGSLQDAGKVPYPHQLFHKSSHTFSLKRARQLLKTLENDFKVPSQVFSPHSVFSFCFLSLSIVETTWFRILLVTCLSLWLWTLFPLKSFPPTLMTLKGTKEKIPVGGARPYPDLPICLPYYFGCQIDSKNEFML